MTFSKMQTRDSQSVSRGFPQRVCRVVATAAMLTFQSTTLSAQGSIHAWGWNEYGQVTDSPAGDDFIVASAGPWHSVAIRTDGSLIAWGRDSTGVVSNAPTGSNFVQVAAGGGFSVALTDTGTIVAWGYDFSGQVSNAPTGSGYTHVACGKYYALAVAADGSLRAWGADGPWGQVSNVPQDTGYYQVAGGFDHSMALKLDGSIVVWGTDTNGQISNAPAGTGITQIAAKATYCQVLGIDGSIRTWGQSSGTIVSDTPSDPGFVQLGLGGTFSAALRSDGSIEAWGSDFVGQVSNAPSGSGFVFLAGGGDSHGLAIRASNAGDPFCFGDGSGLPCPCISNGNPGQGCANSGGLGGATLTASGLAAIGGDSFELLVEGVPGDKPGLVLRGMNQLGSGLGIAVGDGLLCTSGNTARSHVQLTASGTTVFTDFQGSPFGASSYGPGVMTNYQFWYRDTDNTCTGSGFNFSNAWAVSWLP